MPVYRDHDFEIDQGDLLAEVPFILRSGPEIDVRRRLGIVTSHGCDCERYTRERDAGAAQDFLETYAVQVAPVVHTEEFTPGILGDIRKGRVPRYFALDAEGEHPEMLIDLHVEQPVPVMELLDLTRVASLSEEVWLRLVVHCFRLQGRLKSEDVFKDDVVP